MKAARVNMFFFFETFLKETTYNHWLPDGNVTQATSCETDILISNFAEMPYTLNLVIDVLTELSCLLSQLLSIKDIMLHQ